MFNSVYRIELSGRPEPVVLKVSAKPEAPVLTCEKGLMATEVRMLKLPEEHPSLPAPHILAEIRRIRGTSGSAPARTSTSPAPPR